MNIKMFFTYEFMFSTFCFFFQFIGYGYQLLANKSENLAERGKISSLHLTLIQKAKNLKIKDLDFKIQIKEGLQHK